jgi:hypothetical protein
MAEHGDIRPMGGGLESKFAAAGHSHPVEWDWRASYNFGRILCLQLALRSDEDNITVSDRVINRHPRPPVLMVKQEPEMLCE